ncbi:MAG: chemotaxis-specific protein-glutamate methyltransferase CheB [Bacteroidales bacterium]|nr:chemotaxis-specific protein-glutamate methyltransferase CheB [Bacteroidales bacterium]
MIKKKSLKVMIVEDSAAVAELLFHILNSDPEIEVIAKVSNGLEAINYIKNPRTIKPDVISMDIEMPVMNGLEATRAIMDEVPTPILIVTSSWEPRDLEGTYDALQSGAMGVVQKPRGLDHPDHYRLAHELITWIKKVSQVTVKSRARKAFNTSEFGKPSMFEHEQKANRIKPEVIVIGTSTGGPPLLKKMLQSLSSDLKQPILIVQHIAVGFVEGLVEWLNKESKLNIHLAEDKMVTQAGHVYIAPANYHMTVNIKNQITLVNEDPMYSVKPSVGYLFESVSKSYGNKVLGVLLTGMGRDGGAEMRMMRDQGAVTIAQSEETCVIFGMPKTAIDMDGATFVMSPDQIVDYINQL